MIAHIPDLCCQQYLTGAEFTLILDADVNMRKQQKRVASAVQMNQRIVPKQSTKAKRSDGSY
jgi:hypothetical protein